MSGLHPSSGARTLSLLREGALTGGAVAGVVCLVFALLGVTAGVRPLVFTSGSMARRSGPATSPSRGRWTWPTSPPATW